MKRWLLRILGAPPAVAVCPGCDAMKDALRAAEAREKVLLDDLRRSMDHVAALGTERAHVLVARANAPPQERKEPHPDGPRRAAYPPYIGMVTSGGHARIADLRRKLKQSRPMTQVPPPA